MKNYNTLEGNWKRIEGYNHYLISDDGRVFSEASNKYLSIVTKNNGYKAVNLWMAGKGKMFYVHRLVLFHFSDNEPKETANHLDGNKANNHISNLEWCSYLENNLHAIKEGLNVKKNNKSSIKVRQHDLNGNLIKEYPSMRQAERETGVTATEIGLGIEKGWKYGGFIWTKSI
jgi:hypothetical protein